MFYATSDENFERYSNQYNANQVGRSNAFAQASDIHEALAAEGFEQMEVADDLKRLGAYSVWMKGWSVQIVFEV